MSAIYDNWERLVAAVLKKQQLWQLFHQHSRSPSVLSEASGFSSSFSSSLDFARLGSSSTYRRAPKLVFVSDFSQSIGLKDVYLDSTELLGRGAFGTVYAVVMSNGVRIVVKRLKDVSVSESEFNRHMAIVGNVRHENVAPLRAYYCSQDERVVLYDYYRRGSVYALLHGGNGVPRQASVDWESRLKIAIGAARGIAEIHRHNGGKLIHGNIKASNVFYNPDLYGCVSDLGLTNLIETTFMSTSHCYAPEVKNTQNLSQASDVYSFGVLLLELLTRKPSVHEPDGPKAVDLVKLVTSVINRVRAAKVFDADLLKHPTIKEQMVKMFQIGLRCVEKSIKKRPKMSEVVKMLEEITTLNPISRAREARELVFVGDSNPTFDLEDLLKASAEVLGKGTFGNSYKAILESGNVIMVKRLRDVVVTSEDFQYHMEIIGRMNHENVAGLRAYTFNFDDKLLLYDYYNQDSVSALLHGKLGDGNSGKTPLNWETRLKIAVGAARGIAHIHKQDGQKLVHGNIKSSNIFLNRQKFGIVCDAGLAKLTAPIRRSRMLAPDYNAPEVTDTTRVSQASDIYSFGVLLLELLSGKPSQITADDGKVISLVSWIQSIDRGEWIPQVFDVEFLGFESEETKVQLLQIAMDCVSILPERRPRMFELVNMLEEISGIEPSDETISEDVWEQPSAESRLEDLLEDMFSTLPP